jgi:hypothetical protein
VWRLLLPVVVVVLLLLLIGGFRRHCHRHRLRRAGICVCMCVVWRTVHVSACAISRSKSVSKMIAIYCDRLSIDDACPVD